MHASLDMYWDRQKLNDRYKISLFFFSKDKCLVFPKNDTIKYNTDKKVTCKISTFAKISSENKPQGTSINLINLEVVSEGKCNNSIKRENSAGSLINNQLGIPYIVSRGRQKQLGNYEGHKFKQKMID